jgi:hypothetical protein
VSGDALAAPKPKARRVGEFARPALAFSGRQRNSEEAKTVALLIVSLFLFFLLFSDH